MNPVALNLFVGHSYKNSVLGPLVTLETSGNCQQLNQRDISSVNFPGGFIKQQFRPK